MPKDSQYRRFEAARKLFLACQENPRADQPLDRWSVPSDRHLPSVLIRQTLRQVLNTPFSLLSTTKGVGATKLDRLMAVVERAVTSLQPNATDSSVPIPQSFCSPFVESTPPKCSAIPSEPQSVTLTPDSLDERQWRVLSAKLAEHGIDKYPIGRLSRSLLQLSRGIWHELLSSFTQCSLAEIHSVSGYGEVRVKQVLQIVIDLGTFLSSLPGDSHYKVQVFPAAIHNLSHWIEQVLADDELPSLDALRTNFISPLMRQLETDLGADVTEMVERRLGNKGPPETLDEVATDFDLTRERIRQLTLRAREVVQVRWPEGKHVLDDFYERFRNNPKAHEQIELVRRLLDILLAASTNAATTYEDVLAAWETHGGRKQTPLTAAQIRSWLASLFPDLPPQVGFHWIAQEAKSIENERNGTLFFSSDELDLLLYDLYQRGVPTALSTIFVFDGTEERNMRGRVSRDIRIIEDEYRRLLPAEHYSLHRDSGEWQIEIAPARPGSRPRQSTIAVAGLAHLTASGLLQAGIADATVWGVHRYANEMLARMFDAKLPDKVTPFILADAMVRLSNGLFRPMRRRRLRWDIPNSGIPARGKRGWVGYILLQYGMPVTVEELGDLLRNQYQDYAPYVLAQLDLDAEEEGDYHCSAIWYPGIPHRIPPILVPANWELHPERDNISPEIEFLASRIITMTRDNTIKKHDLVDVPWLIELAERHSYGENIWQNGITSTREGRKTAIPLGSHSTEGHPPNGRPQMEETAEIKARSTSEVDELLSKFL